MKTYCLLFFLSSIGAFSFQSHPGGTPLGTAQSNQAEVTEYILGADDVLTITASEEESLNNKQPIRIDTNGQISLPLIGRMQAAGLTAGQLEASIKEHLRSYVKEPRVSVAISEFGSQPVTVIGAVNAPGVHQIKGAKKLLEMLSLAGGLRPDAGYIITITRQLSWGQVPLPDAKDDLEGKFSVATVQVDGLLRGQNPEGNIAIRPHDTISVPTADVVFVMGEVRKPGEYAIRRAEQVSILSALSKAEGFTRTASPSNAMILRRTPKSADREQIHINLSKIMTGKAPDVVLQENDILLVPNSKIKSITLRSTEAAIQIGTGLAVFGGH